MGLTLFQMELLAFLEELGDEFKIDFSGIVEAESAQLYQFYCGFQADFNQQTDDFLNSKDNLVLGDRMPNI